MDVKRCKLTKDVTVDKYQNGYHTFKAGTEVLVNIENGSWGDYLATRNDGDFKSEAPWSFTLTVDEFEVIED